MRTRRSPSTTQDFQRSRMRTTTLGTSSGIRRWRCAWSLMRRNGKSLSTGGCMGRGTLLEKSGSHSVTTCWLRVVKRIWLAAGAQGVCTSPWRVDTTANSLGTSRPTRSALPEPHRKERLPGKRFAPPRSQRALRTEPFRSNAVSLSMRPTGQENSAAAPERAQRVQTPRRSQTSTHSTYKGQSHAASLTAK